MGQFGARNRRDAPDPLPGPAGELLRCGRSAVNDGRDEAGIADAVSFARRFIANPDLVSRFALGGGLAASDRSTHYRGGPRGYTDYPMWMPSGAWR